MAELSESLLVKVEWTLVDYNVVELVFTLYLDVKQATHINFESELELSWF